MKYKAIVRIEYCFDFECDSNSRIDIENKAEEIWEQKQIMGEDEICYEDTEIDVFGISEGSLEKIWNTPEEDKAWKDL